MPRHTPLLPEGFAALIPHVAQWAIAGSAARAQARSESSAKERASFFTAAKPLAGAALDLLDRKPVDQLDETETRLMNLMLSFAHVALAVEIQGKAEAQHARYRTYMRITHTPAPCPANAGIT